MGGRGLAVCLYQGETLSGCGVSAEYPQSGSKRTLTDRRGWTRGGELHQGGRAGWETTGLMAVTLQKSSWMLDQTSELSFNRIKLKYQY